MSDKPSAPLPTGQTLDETIVAGRYQILRLVARGGMAEVYLAQQIGLGRPVALKVLKPPDSEEDIATFEDRFRLEAQTLASLDHPNIVTLFDFGELEDGRFFLAMEYVDGPRLTDLLKTGPLDPARAIRLLLQVCGAVRYAHKQGVVHRDLKPSNLLIRINEEEQTEVVKVVDFGLVKLTEQDQSLTRAGLVLGSPHCMAPEQVKGINIDQRADIYAIGVLLFRSITGRYPFHGTNSTATMIAHLNQPVPSMRSANPEATYPPGTEEVVRKCLEKSPQARYSSMRELILALAPLVDLPPDQYASLSMTHSTIQRQLTPPPGSARTPRWPFVLALASLVLTLVGLTTFAGGVVLAALNTNLSAPAPVTQQPVGTGEVMNFQPAPPATTGTGEAPSAPETTHPEPEPEPVPATMQPVPSAEGEPSTSAPQSDKPPVPSKDPVTSTLAPSTPDPSEPAPSTPVPTEPASSAGTDDAEPPPSEASADPAAEPVAEPASSSEAPEEPPPADKAPTDGYMAVPDDMFE